MEAGEILGYCRSVFRAAIPTRRVPVAGTDPTDGANDILMNDGAYEALNQCCLAEIDAKPGRVKGFERFLREHREALLAFLRQRTATEEDAQDAVQESMARLMRYQNEQTPEGLKALLYRIAVNVAHDQRRRAVRRHSGEHVPLDETVHALTSTDPPLDEQMVRRQELAVIAGVIESLPTRCREIYILSRIEGMKNAEIADFCGISLKAVEKQMTRAMAAVRRASGKTDREAF